MDAVPGEEVVFEPGVFLLTKAKAQALKSGAPPPEKPAPAPAGGSTLGGGMVEPTSPEPTALGPTEPATQILRLVGTVPPELWNRLGTKILPKL